MQKNDIEITKKRLGGNVGVLEEDSMETIVGLLSSPMPLRVEGKTG